MTGTRTQTSQNPKACTPWGMTQGHMQMFIYLKAFLFASTDYPKGKGCSVTQKQPPHESHNQAPFKTKGKQNGKQEDLLENRRVWNVVVCVQSLLFHPLITLWQDFESQTSEAATPRASPSQWATPLRADACFQAWYNAFEWQQTAQCLLVPRKFSALSNSILCSLQLRLCASCRLPVACCNCIVNCSF